jgi:lipoyl(octanoyl) transferase
MRWFFLNSGLGAAAENMAWDAALLEAAPRLGAPVLRFYGWTEAAATFGYFQHYADIERLTPLRPIIRRPTGGGFVPHDHDWTYSLAFPPADPWHALKAVESYRRVHEWVQSAFAACRVSTELSPSAVKEAPGQCFIGAEQFDVLLDAKKIAGAAQRRTRDGLLIQGSIQPPPGVVREAFERAMLDVATMQWGVEWEDFQPGDALKRRAAELAADRFGRAEFNARR